MKLKDKLVEDIKSRENLDLHYVARVLQTISNQRDVDGLRKIKNAYIDSLLEGRFSNQTNAAKRADENLYIASRLADIVKEDNGNEASGQLMGAANIKSPNVGPVAQFYQENTGYTIPKS